MPRRHARRFSTERAATPWGTRHLRWIHQDDAHELRCTNAGMAHRARRRWSWRGRTTCSCAPPGSCPSCCATFAAYADLGLLSLSRGLNCLPVDEPIDTLGGPDRLAAAAEHDRARARQLVPPAGSRHRDPARGSCGAPVSIASGRSTRPSARRNGTRRISRTGSGRRAGRSRRAATSASAATTISAARRSARVRRRRTSTRVLRNGRLFHERWDATIARSIRGRGARGCVVRPLAGWGATAAAIARAAGRSVRAHPGDSRLREPEQTCRQAWGVQYRSAELARAASHPDSAGRAPAWLRAPLKRAYDALLAALPGDHLTCRLPGGETIRVDPDYRHLAWNAEEYAALKHHARAGRDRAGHRRERGRLHALVCGLGRRDRARVRLRAGGREPRRTPASSVTQRPVGPGHRAARGHRRTDRHPCPSSTPAHTETTVSCRPPPARPARSRR